MIRRTSLVLIELVAGFLAALVVVVAVAVWKLSSGPISLSFLTPYIEEALNAQDGRFAVRIRDMGLTWGGWQRVVDIRANGVAVADETGKVVATVPEVSIGLSMRAMLRGRIAPTSLDLYGLEVTVERNADGRVAIGGIAAGDQAADKAFVESLPRFAKQLLAPPGGAGRFGFLQRISVLGIALRFEDRLLDAAWYAPSADIVLLRGRDGIEVDALMDLDFEGRRTRLSGHLVFPRDAAAIDVSLSFDKLFPTDLARRLPGLGLAKRLDMEIGGRLEARLGRDGTVERLSFDLDSEAGRVTGQVAWPRRDGRTALRIELDGLRPAEFVHLFPGLAELAVLDVAVTGRVAAEFGYRANLDRIDFELSGGPGWLDLGDRLPGPVEIDGVRLKGRVEDGLYHAEIEEAFIDFGGPALTATASAQRIGDRMRVRFDATVEEVPMADLSAYWPIGLGVAARRWVLENITAGKVREGRLNMVAEIPVDDPRSIGVESLSGTLRYEGLEVSYFAALPKVVDVWGTASFGRDRFDLSISGGKLHDITVDDGVINMTQLDTDNERIRIDLLLRGPLETALEVIDHEPLRFVSDLGLDPKAITGAMAMRLGFRFPLRTDVTADQIDVYATANLRGMTLKNGPYGLSARDGDLELRLGERTMQVGGTIKLNGVPVTLDWFEDFNRRTEFRSRYIVSGLIDDAARRALGVPRVPFLAGPVETNLILTTFDDGRSELLIGLDLAKAAMAIAPLGWLKPVGMKGSANLVVGFDAQGHPSVDKFQLRAGNLEAEGRVVFPTGTAERWRVELRSLAYDGNSLAGTVAARTDGGYDVDVVGKRFDIAPVLERDEIEGRERRTGAVDGPGVPLSIRARFDEVSAGPARRFADLRLEASYDGRRWRRLRLEAMVSERGGLRIDYGPEGDGMRLELGSDDAGAMFKALDWTDKMEGGTITISARRVAPDTPLVGKVKIKRYKVTKAPMLARLLQVASLTGIFDVLGRRGLDFVRFDGRFVYDDGQLEIAKSRTYGSSIGITVEGNVDLEDGLADLRGTVVPAYTVNRVLGKIPILGPLLTGGKDEGVFAATYVVKGPLEHPEVKVNPLSALAPGFLRNLFNVIGGEGKGTSQGKAAPPTQ